MYVQPDTLEQHVRFLKKHFVIVPLSELFSMLRKDGEKSSTRPLCALTFDDGWYDFYSNAFPILKAHQAQATVFLPTDFIGTDEVFWTDQLGNILLKRTSSEGPVSEPDFLKNPLAHKIAVLKGPLESRLESAIPILKACRVSEIRDVLAELSEAWKPELPEGNRSFITWDEVRKMGQSGVITFGSHTARHLILTNLNEEEVRDELVRSKEKLVSENVVDLSFIPFCYPNGCYNEAIVKMVKDTGYSLAVTDGGGWNCVRSDPFGLKRVAIHQDVTFNESMFGSRIVGLL